MKLCMAIVILLMTVANVQAASVAPAPRDITIERTFDRSSPPSGDISIWTRESGGYDRNRESLWGRNSWVCESNSSAEHGKCATSPSWGASGTTSIPLIFTERRSGMRVALTLKGYLEVHDADDLCYGWSTRYRDQVFGAILVTCSSGGYYEEAGLTAYIPASELSKLPVGGMWEAELHLNLTQWDPRVTLAKWVAHIRLQVIDPNHIEIYFPEFGTASPLMELNLHPRGAVNSNAWASDVTYLDMCLYDGYNSNSTRYDVLIKDEGAPAAGRADGDFSIYREGAQKGPEADRIDFHLNIKSPEDGSLQPVKNGEQITWMDFGNRYVRPVRLPSISYPVLCAPTPLTFIVDKFNIKEKAAGRYKGTVTVIFTPTTPTVD